jgi:hypothetical protein
MKHKFTSCPCIPYNRYKDDRELQLYQILTVEMSDQHIVAHILVEHGTNNTNTYNTYLSGNSLFQALQTHHFQQETDSYLKRCEKTKLGCCIH